MTRWPAALLAGLLARIALASPAEPITFADATKKAGLTFKYRTDLRRGRMIATMGGGVAIGDYDGDSFLDLYFAGSVANGKRPAKGPCGVLYRNRGDGTFEDVTGRSQVRVCGWAMGAAFVDVDSDGRLDLVVTGLGRTSLLRNQGDGTFRDVTGASGLAAPGFAIGLAAGDADGDGRVDLYVVNYLDTTYEKELSFPALEIRFPDDYAGQDALLFSQRADGTFVERAAEAGVRNHDGKGLGAVFLDYDGDGRSDLYVANDRASNVLYRGIGDGTFHDVTAETGAGAREGSPRAGMGLAVGDLDGDGHPDLVVTNFAGEPTSVYRNVDGVLFDDASESSGIGKPSLPQMKWGADLVDLDDDGALDLVSTSGHLVPRFIGFMVRLFGKKPNAAYQMGNRSFRQPPMLFRNLGEGRFADVTATSGDLADVRLAGRGLAAGDLDGDGRVDVVMAAQSGGIRLLRNTTASRSHALEILPTASGGRTALGTKVAVTTGGRRQVQEVVLRPSYASGAWVPLHFGLGDAETADRVEVFPPGATEPAAVFEAVRGDRLYELRDGHLAERRAFRNR